MTCIGIPLVAEGDYILCLTFNIILTRILACSGVSVSSFAQTGYSFNNAITPEKTYIFTF